MEEGLYLVEDLQLVEEGLQLVVVLNLWTRDCDWWRSRGGTTTGGGGNATGGRRTVTGGGAVTCRGETGSVQGTGNWNVLCFSAYKYTTCLYIKCHAYCELVTGMSCAFQHSNTPHVCILNVMHTAADNIHTLVPTMTHIPQSHFENHQK